MEMLEVMGRNTIYINNLNEKIKIESLKKSLLAVFSQFGRIVDISAAKNLKMRGQAFIAFDQESSATTALNTMQGFPFYDKPLKIQYAKSDSDCVLKQMGDKGEVIIRERKFKRKLLSSNKSSCKKIIISHPPPIKSNSSPLKQVQNFTPNVAPLPIPTLPSEDVEMKPNNILFVRNLPQSTNEMMLQIVFSRFPGFKEIRLVPGRPEFAFVEFGDITTAAIAMNALQNTFNITFAKK